MECCGRLLCLQLRNVGRAKCVVPITFPCATWANLIVATIATATPYVAFALLSLTNFSRCHRNDCNPIVLRWWFVNSLSPFRWLSGSAYDSWCRWPKKSKWYGRSCLLLQYFHVRQVSTLFFCFETHVVRFRFFVGRSCTLRPLFR